MLLAWVGVVPRNFIKRMCQFNINISCFRLIFVWVVTQIEQYLQRYINSKLTPTTFCKAKRKWIVFRARFVHCKAILDCGYSDYVEFWIESCPRCRTITLPVNLQSRVLLLCHGYPLLRHEVDNMNPCSYTYEMNWNV